MKTKKQKALKLEDPIESNRELIIKACTDIKNFADCFFRPHHIQNNYNKMHFDYFETFQPIERGRHLVIQAARGRKDTFIC